MSPEILNNLAPRNLEEPFDYDRVYDELVEKEGAELGELIAIMYRLHICSEYYTVLFYNVMGNYRPDRAYGKLCLKSLDSIADSLYEIAYYLDNTPWRWGGTCGMARNIALKIYDWTGTMGLLYED